MVTNKRRLPKKIKGSGPGASTMRPSAIHSIKAPRSRPHSAHTKTRSAKQNMSHKSTKHYRKQNLGVVRNNSAPAILPTQLKAFKTTDELKQAVQNYFTNKIRRDEVITEYGNISDWNTSKITDMTELFENIKPLTGDNLIQLNWDTSNVTNMKRMFGYCYLNFKINFTNTSKVTDMSYMFYRAIKFNQPLPESFDTSNVTNMCCMFSTATNFNQPLNFNTSKATNMYGMFIKATNFNQPLNFNTSNVTHMAYMFYSATNFNQPLHFNTSNVIDMAGMFSGSTNFNQPLQFITGNVITMDGMFRDATNFNQPLNFDTSNVIDMSDMFRDATNFNQHIRFVTNIDDFDGLKEMFSDTRNLLSPIYIKVNSSLNLLRAGIDKDYLFEGSKIIKHPEYIKITEHEISVLGDDIHMFAYALTEADKRHASKTGTIRKYPAHTIDFDEFNEFLRK